MLEVKSLGKRFGHRWIFQDVSFDLEPTQRLAVLGRNGSGKSTLLKVIAGLIPSTAGSIAWIGGDPRRAVGFSALDGSLYPELTVREHLELIGKWRGCEARTDELLEFTGMTYAADYRASTLSTGMRSRVKLAIAIQSKPAVLLLDEPGAALDEDGRTLLNDVIEHQAKEGAVILATNDPDERRHATHELSLG